MTAPGTSALVSVIVPAWQHERHAEAALQSAYDQNHEAVEIIVVEDASYPRVAGMIRGYLEREEVRSRFLRTVLIENSGQMGASHAINRGPQESQGDYISILEADDAFATHRFARLVIACGEGGAEFAFMRVEPLADPAASSLVEAEYVYEVQDDIGFFPSVGYALLRSQCAISTGNFFFSRRLAERAGGFGNHGRSAGWDFALRCLLVTEPIFMPEQLYFYRLHGHQRFEELRAQRVNETRSVLKRYFFLCRNRPVTNPVAPSPAWGPFFDSFVEASHYGKYLAQP